MTSIPALLLLALAAAQNAPTALSPAERALTAFVDKDYDRALALLERVVNINSGTMNLAGVRAVGDACGPSSTLSASRPSGWTEHPLGEPVISSPIIRARDPGSS
jgi:hypothetical protein